MIEEQAGAFEQCEVCGRHVDDCICPECPDCGNVGDAHCYDHGHDSDDVRCVVQLQRNEAQIIGRQLLLEAIEAEEDRYAREFEAEMERASDFGHDY